MVSDIVNAAVLGMFNGGAAFALVLAYLTPPESGANRSRNRYRNAHGQRAAVDRYLSDLRRSA